VSDDRSERLRRRRKQSTEGAPETGGSPTRSTGGGPSDSTEAGDASSVKDAQTGTYMYLPEAQVKDMRRVYNVLKAQYEYEFDEPFEKNRHFYPLVVRFGLDRLREMEPATIRDRLEDLP
jgi:hypothetical protein